MKFIKDWWNEKARLRAERDKATLEANQLRTRINYLQDDVARERATSADLVKRFEAELDQVKARARVPRVVKVPERALKEAELLDALAVAQDNTLWRAVHQLLDEQIADAVDLVAKRPEPDPRSGVVAVTPDTRNFHAGGIEHLRDFQARLLDWQAKAAKADAAEESAEE